MSIQPSVEPSASAGGSDAARWFAEQVHPNDSSLRAYLRHSFPSVPDVDDLVQESYQLFGGVAHEEEGRSEAWTLSAAATMGFAHSGVAARSFGAMILPAST